MPLVIVSNRLPVTLTVSSKGGPASAGKKRHVSIGRSAGGLATGLSSYLASLHRGMLESDYIWVGWPGLTDPSVWSPELRDRLRSRQMEPVTTDEDMFKALPESAFTVRVGPGKTEARLRLENPSEVRRLLSSLVA